MTLSYSVGLTGGSAVAYLLDMWLGPHLTYDPCVPHNHTQIFPIGGYHNATEMLKALSGVP